MSMRCVVRPQKRRNIATLANPAWTRTQWSNAFLHTIGNMAPTNKIVGFVNAWGTYEGGGGSLIQGSTDTCQGNMLATCQKVAGSTGCNPPHCVQSYRSNSDGIYANSLAIKNGNYPHLLQALVTNDEDSLGFNGHTMTADIAGDLSVWVSGSRTGNLGYAASVASLAGAKSGSSAGGTTTVKKNGNSQGGGTSTSTQKPSGNAFTDALSGILGSGTLAWIQNPMRVIKLLVGIMCIGLSIYLLVAPDAASTVSKVAPFLA